MKEWIFHICRNALRLPMGIFLRKIHFDGIENYPKNVPVLLACNHPNSFLDGVIFEHLSGRKVYTLARGDAFLNPTANFILRGMRLLPIFRARDAAAEVARKGNAATKDEIYELFTKNNSVLIFSEGIGYPEKGLRKLKKGTGQIAVDSVAKSNFSMDLYVVPTALNYSKFWTLQQTVHVTYGKPVRVLDHVDLIKKDEKAFVELVTNSIQESLEKNVVLTKGDYTDEKEFAQEILINENYKPLTFKIKDQWEYSIEKLNTMSESFADKVASYKEGLDNANVLDANVGNRSFDFISALIAIFTAGVSFPIYMVWWLLWYGVDVVIRKKIRNIVFWDSVKVGLMMILSVILAAVVYNIAGHFSTAWWPLFFTTLGIYGAICWFRLTASLSYIWKEIRWAGLNKDVRNSLRAQRSAILEAFR